MKKNWQIKYFNTNKIILTKYEKGIRIPSKQTDLDKKKKELNPPKQDEQDFELFLTAGAHNYTLIKKALKAELKQKRTRNMISDYVNNHFLKNHSFWYITIDPIKFPDLPYDLPLIKKEVSNFIRRLKYIYYPQKGKKLRKNEFRYLMTFERHASGRWHIHIIFNTTFPKEVLEDTWGYGYCNAKKIYKTKNLGAYVSKYLTKMFFHLPPRFRSFIRSKNLTQPQKIYAMSISNEWKKYNYYRIRYYSTYHGYITKYYLFTNFPDHAILKLLTSLSKTNGYYNSPGRLYQFKADHLKKRW